MLNRYARCKITYFDWKRYEANGFSFGFAECEERMIDGIWLGTKNWVRPQLSGDGEVILVMDGSHKNDHLSREMVENGREIVVFLRRNQRGLWGQWCFAEEWDEKVAELDILKRIEKEREENRRAHADRRQKEMEAFDREHPTTLDIALKNGWTTHRENDKQVIVIRVDPKTGKNQTRTFHVKKQRQPA